MLEKTFSMEWSQLNMEIGSPEMVGMKGKSRTQEEKQDNKKHLSMI